MAAKDFYHHQYITDNTTNEIVSYRPGQVIPTTRINWPDYITSPSDKEILLEKVLIFLFKYAHIVDERQKEWLELLEEAENAGLFRENK